MTADNTNLLTMFGATQDQLDEIQAEASEKNAAKQSRCDASLFQCSIPDWTGQGGVCHFWLNDDGTYESMDSRIGDAEIREGLMRAARN